MNIFLHTFKSKSFVDEDIQFDMKTLSLCKYFYKIKMQNRLNFAMKCITISQNAYFTFLLYFCKNMMQRKII